MTADAAARLGRLLSGSEAGKLASQLADHATLTQALHVIPAVRRAEVRTALEAAGIVPGKLEVAVPVLRAIEGAATANRTTISPIWTLPGHLADYGSLTTAIKDVVLSARVSVTCSTFNFQKSSMLWKVLKEVASRGTVEVRVYMDTEAAEGSSWDTPTCEQVAAQLPGALVHRTRMIDGKYVRNHAKFVAVDHQFLIVTSANFSMSAEQKNVELGLRVHSPALTEMVEQQLLHTEATLYGLVH